MAIQLAAQDVRESLNTHVAAKGADIFNRYGPQIGWEQLQRILQDRTCVRYPCEIAFDAAPLCDGEFAHPVAKGERPEDGYVMHIHPCLETQRDEAILLVLYQLVLVNYGEFASPADAEVFGANALGIPADDFYSQLCQLADRICGCDTQQPQCTGPKCATTKCATDMRNQ